MSSGKGFNGIGKKLTLEAVLKAAFAGVAIGGGVAFVLAFISWFLDFNGTLLIALGFAVTAVISAVLLYFLVFRPTVQSNARRLDSYGLDERVITMVELEGSDSFIAKLQREDAVKHVSAMNQRQIKFRFPRVLVILTLVFTVLMLGMGAVEVLSSVDIVPTGAEVWNTMFPPPPPESFELKYIAEKGGYILGEDEQLVVEGTDGLPVVAVADDGFIFVGWSDGFANPSRTDKAVTGNIERKAVFVKIDDVEVDDDGGDEPDDVPGEDGEGYDPDGGDSDGGGSKYKQNNFVIDGKTYYRDIFEEYYERAMEYVQQGETIPEELRDIIEIYFEIIK